MSSAFGLPVELNGTALDLGLFEMNHIESTRCVGYIDPMNFRTPERWTSVTVYRVVAWLVAM